MKERLFKGKSKRTKLFVAISAVGILLIMALNILLTHVGLYNTVYLDLTPEGLYGLSGAMKDECDTLFDKLRESGENKKIRITFCTDPDYLMNSSESRLTYVMALNLQERYPDYVEVKTENILLNPTSVSQYKTTSLSVINSNDIIVSYGDRYRIAGLSYFWVTGRTERDHYNGEYRLATMMRSVTSIARPAAYFLTGHGESYFDPDNPDSEMSKSLSDFASLLAGRGLEIKLLDITKADAVPDDCALLIMNSPTVDFDYDETKLDHFNYISDSEKIDRYLVSKNGSLAVVKDPEVKLPVLESFLREWGFEFGSSVLVDNESSLSDSVSGEKTGTSIIAEYDTAEDSYGYALYGEYADLSSSPLTVFDNAGYVKCSFLETNVAGEPSSGNVMKQYAPFLTTSKTAQPFFRDSVTGEITGYVDGERGKYDIAAICARSTLDSVSNVTTYSYVFCVNSKNFFESKMLGEDSFANYDIVSAVIENISRVDEHASMDLGAISLNSASGGGKQIITTEMTEADKVIYSNKFVDNNPDNRHVIIKTNRGLTAATKTVITVFIFLVPAAVFVTGVIVNVKRRYL